jgi:ppGpp synthetase/RelA/SpoT-type nucleotidyltranferase
MIYPSILERRYQEYLPFVEAVASPVKDTMLNFCEKNGYALTSRIKTIESLAEKIETGRFKQWSDLDDLFACTVIIPTLNQEQKVTRFCQDTFEISKIIRRGQNKKSPDTFRFDSTRIYARLKRVEDAKADQFLSIFNIKFEIQIKSAFEHAWAVSTHDLVYKSSAIDWKKLRLASQIKATVEQLDTLILAFEQVSNTIQESEDPEIKRKRQLAAATQELFDQAKIPQELKPKDMTRFCDNLYSILASANKENEIPKVIKCIKEKVHSTPSKQIPRSISLLQYFLAILVDNQVIILPLKKYYSHITEELITLYPTFLGNVNSIFQYDI